MFESLPLVLAQNADAPAVDQAAPPSLPQAPSGDATTVQQPGGTAAPGGTTPQNQQSQGLGGSWLPLAFLLMLVVLFIVMSGGQRKEKKKREAMLSAIKKGDRIQTIGGILGSIVEVRDTEVVVKVDENANTRLRFARTAIQSVLEDKQA